MDKHEVMAKLKEQGIIAVVRGKTMEDGVRTAEACIKGGVKAIELGIHHAARAGSHPHAGRRI